jgi:hypothetical protein
LNQNFYIKEELFMERKKFEYDGHLISSISQESLIQQMKSYYDCGMSGDHIVGYFDYAPCELINIFPLCQMETWGSIIDRYRNYKPKREHVKNFYVTERLYKKYMRCDEESFVFPKYSIVDCQKNPGYKQERHVFKIFLYESDHRFIIFTNYHKNKAFFGCGGYGHVLFCGKDDEGASKNDRQ